MMKSISLRRVMTMNVGEIEELFGKERLLEILSMLRKNEKIKEKSRIEKELKKMDEEKNILISDLKKANTELEGLRITY